MVARYGIKIFKISFLKEACLRIHTTEHLLTSPPTPLNLSSSSSSCSLSGLLSVPGLGHIQGLPERSSLFLECLSCSAVTVAPPSTLS